MQLEYDVNAEYSDRTKSKWTPVARFDHDSSGNETNHDIEEEGLHLDIFKNGEKVWTSSDFPNIPLNRAPRYCEEYLEENADRLIERFERWYDKPLQRVA